MQQQGQVKRGFWQVARYAVFAGLLLPAAAMVGCSDDDDAIPVGGPGVLPDNAALVIGGEQQAEPNAAGYTDVVLATYEDALADVQALQQGINAFVAAPSEAGFAAAKSAWIASRESWGQTEVFRFYDGPIDNPETGFESAINGWPMDECTIDYCVGAEDSGIVNDPNVTIDAQTLFAANQETGETDITTGFHAIEFLLWGQDFNDDGPGLREYTDYVDAAGAERRGQYLSTVTALLVEHVQSLVTAWQPNSDNFRRTFVAQTPEEAVTQILTGMIVLSGFETGGERLRTALDTGDQEDEHSCFSDNTHRDMVTNVLGVRNVCRGAYTRNDGSTLSGTGVCALIAASDADLAARVEAQLDQSLQLAEALQPPFDQEIAVGNTEGNARVQALIDSLFELRGLLAEEVVPAFGLQVVEPE